MPALKWFFGLALAVGVSSGISADDDAESAKRVEELAGRFEFFASADLKTKFERQPKPLLKYTNPVRGQVYGNVFVWTHQGRPEVLAAVFDYRSERTLYSELHTLARAGVVARRDEKEFWKPSEPGVTYKAVPGAPAPADTDKARLLQMRELARDFAVERKHPESGKEALRLMTNPVFRYASPQTKTLDGAIFVFVDETTDPEAYLLLEASGGDKPAWQFALARMNIVEFWADHKGKRVWGVEEVDWATVYDRQGPYAIVRETPPRGLVRKP